MGLKNIGVGIDRSQTAADALRWAVDFAQASDAAVTAFSSWQMPFVGVLPGPIEGLPSIEVMAEQCARALHQVVSEVEPDAGVEQVVVEGKPGPALLDAAKDADLLVVGRTGHGKRHGLSRIAEIALGSTARHCIHHARIPVAAIPEGSLWSSPSTVVVGVDGSSSSLDALNWALTHLSADTTLHVVRAFAPWVGDGLTPADLVTDKRLHEAFRHETQQWVDTAMTNTSRDALVPVVEVAIGNPRDVLADPGYGVDLIIVGERGRTGIASMVLGSVSDHLVRYATCPVLVVPDMSR